MFGDIPGTQNDPSQYGSTYTDWDAVIPGFTAQVSGNQSGGESWLDTAQRLIQTGLATWQQKQIMQINIDRAKQGLAPISGADAGLQVGVGLSDQTRTMLWVLGGGALALLAVMALSRRRG